MLIGMTGDISGWSGGEQQEEGLSRYLRSWDLGNQDLETSHDGGAVSGLHQATGGPSPHQPEDSIPPKSRGAGQAHSRWFPGRHHSSSDSGLMCPLQPPHLTCRHSEPLLSVLPTLGSSAPICMAIVCSHPAPV